MTWSIVPPNGLVSPCGWCDRAIGAGQTYATFSSGLVRCEECMRERFGEQPPADVGTASLVVPQPSLPMQTERLGHGFVTAGELARRAQADYKRRQTGERE